MTTATLPTQSFPPKSTWLDRPLWKRLTPAVLIVVAIMLLSTVLHFSNLSAISDANAYYTAAVKSMLQSWHNFFFVAAEPGGSVSVDKPPLGLWIEAAFAAVLGVSGFAVSLPNILAGIFSIPILYHLVKKYLGTLAGLIAGLVVAITPVVLATDRNNTMDGMLVFTLLLAAWAFIKAAESGKLSWLLLGGVMVGLGFNIKMMQAFLPLPAFYALYFFGSKVKWGRKLAFLALTDRKSVV
jgi:4-amino-4-deoxy-L-arabinose transferase-like glycosyltransferase